MCVNDLIQNYYTLSFSEPNVIQLRQFSISITEGPFTSNRPFTLLIRSTHTQHNRLALYQASRLQLINWFRLIYLKR